MSHACLIVALSPEDLERAGGDLKKAVAHQMEPFDENGQWFKEGSRWDWWVIGGRFTGRLRPGYDPMTDPANLETCWLCQGTGMRKDALGAEERRRDPAYTCNGCEGKGKSVKFPTQWVQVGNVCRRGDLGGTEPHLTAYAFLKDRRWHEQARLGWFGKNAPTECDIKAEEETGEGYTGRCLHKCPETGAQVVSFAEMDEASDRWQRLFWARFLRNLPPDTILVVVDYHV